MRSRYFGKLIRGRIEIKRFFNNDQFVISITFATPDWGHSRYSDTIRSAQRIDPKDLLISVNGKHFEYEKDWKISKDGYTLGERDQFKTIDPLFKYQNTNIEFKPDDVKYFNLYNIIITSKKLNLKFKELKSIVFQQTYPNHEIWEIKKENLDLNEHYLTTVNNKINFNIADYYSFDFGEIDNDLLGSSKSYVDGEIIINDFEHKNKTYLASIKIKDNKTRTFNKTPELEYKNWAPFSVYNDIFTRHQSLSKNGFESFSGELWNNLNNRDKLSREVISNIYTSGQEINKYYWNEPTEFNYSTKQINNSNNFDSRGLFIPYSHMGNLSTHFKYQFDLGGENKPIDFVKLNISHRQKIDKPLLDPSYGKIKLEINDASIEVPNIKYSLDSKEIESFVKLNPLDVRYFERFAKNNE